MWLSLSHLALKNRAKWHCWEDKTWGRRRHLCDACVDYSAWLSQCQVVGVQWLVSSCRRWVMGVSFLLCIQPSWTWLYWWLSCKDLCRKAEAYEQRLRQLLHTACPMLSCQHWDVSVKFRLFIYQVNSFAFRCPTWLLFFTKTLFITPTTWWHNRWKIPLG